MALYERGNIWYYTFYVRGRRYRGSTKESDERKAQRVESLKLARAIEKGSDPGSRRAPVLSAFKKDFFDWVEKSHLEKGSKLYYRTGWKLLAGTKLTGCRLDQISTDLVAGIEMGSSPSNRNNGLRTLHRALEKAREWNLIAQAPTIRLAKEYGRDAIIEPWMELKLMEVMSADRVPTKKCSPRKGVNYSFQPLQDVLTIMLDAGMRPAEIFCLRWEDVRWDRHSIFVPKGKSRRARRFVPMSDRIETALKARGPKLSGFVFPSTRAKSGHITGRCIAKQWKYAKLLAELPSNIVLYCARHRYGTDVMEGTGNLAAVMATMGHEKAQTAMIYQHPHIHQVREVINERNKQIAENAAAIAVCANEEGAVGAAPWTQTWTQ